MNYFWFTDIDSELNNIFFGLHQYCMSNHISRDSAPLFSSVYLQTLIGFICSELLLYLRTVGTEIDSILFFGLN